MEIMGAIIRRLHETQPGCEVYGETVPQGFRPPCFVVLLLESRLERLSPDRFLWRNAFDVRFFPDGERPRAACRARAAALCQALESLPGYLRARSVSWEITDDVLHFFVSYNPIVRREAAPLQYMERLHTDVAPKGETRQ